jgi:alpha-beta hydrolase superfamily lysophospholipase
VTVDGVERHQVDNGAGWMLSLRRYPRTSGTKGRPLLIVPGYGMNSFIFGFHPQGLSLAAYLASRGIEVWTVDLRGQGDSTKTHDAQAAEVYGLGDLAVTDLSAAIGRVLEVSGQRELNLLGASLGASLVFAHLACVAGAPVHTVVCFGGLVTWVEVPTVLKTIFASPRIAGALRLKGTRKLAALALPTLARWAPGFLSIYIHAQSTDISHTETMVRTVEDPNPHINREIAEWISRRELVVRGVNVSRALAQMFNPMICVVANQDGIVPKETARAPYDAIGSEHKELLAVGDAKKPIAHADLFLSTGAQDRIFAKVADFILRHEEH